MAYRALPGPIGAKVRIKDAIYVVLGPVFFRGTPSYVAWRNDRRRNDGRLERLKGSDQTVLDPGEAIIIKTPTGGGFGAS